MDYITGNDISDHLGNRNTVNNANDTNMESKEIEKGYYRIQAERGRLTNTKQILVRQSLGANPIKSSTAENVVAPQL